MMDIFIKLDKGPGMWSSCLESPKINPSTHKQGSTKKSAGNRRTGTARPSFRHHTVGSGTHESLPQEKQQNPHFIMWTYAFNLAPGKCLQTSKFAWTNRNYKRSQCTPSKCSSHVLPIGLCLCSLLDLNHWSCSGPLPFLLPYIMPYARETREVSLEHPRSLPAVQSLSPS